MAGLRIEVLIANADIIPLIRIVLVPFHLSVASIKIAITFLNKKSNIIKIKRNVSIILKEKNFYSMN